jgi:hypothetical protein
MSAVLPFPGEKRSDAATALRALAAQIDAGLAVRRAVVCLELRDGALEHRLCGQATSANHSAGLCFAVGHRIVYPEAP